MEYRTLGDGGPRVSLLGYGAWALGGDGWDGVDLEEAHAVLDAMLEAGVTFIDTAPIYGMGKSEERLGEFLAGRRENVVLATKCGLVWDGTGSVWKDISRDAILRDLESSLRRLRTDHIDLYQVHWPDNRTPFRETFGTLRRLQEEGVVRHVGVSNYDRAGLEKAAAFCRIASVQNRYNMLQREDEKTVLPWCRENGVGYIPYSPLAQGLLSGKIGPDYSVAEGSSRAHNPLFTDRDKFGEALAFAGGLEKPPARTALRFLFDRPEIASVIVSVTKRRHLEENLAALPED